ncbi:MAG: FeoB-associated Cys-rich membrane protein [Peptoniphilus sp.]|nr:FeoB-associated Cys-rich membrane protein [Peptoniphilus sp.]MDY3118748.1 FeoB-associated Cys-rich membrane protein [Peptoniphilus sp.]
MGTVIVLAVVICAVVGAVVSMRRSHKEGGCSGCSQCGSGACAHEHKQ